MRASLEPVTSVLTLGVRPPTASEPVDARASRLPHDTAAGSLVETAAVERGDTRRQARNRRDTTAASTEHTRVAKECAEAARGTTSGRGNGCIPFADVSIGRARS